MEMTKEMKDWVEYTDNLKKQRELQIDEEAKKLTTHLKSLWNDCVCDYNLETEINNDELKKLKSVSDMFIDNLVQYTDYFNLYLESKGVQL